MVRVIKVSGLDDPIVLRLSEHLEDPTVLMIVLGDYFVEMSEEAFEKQEYGGVPWLPRYPNQEGDDTFINIAGVIQDLNESDKIQKHRFEPRPALVGSGDLEAGMYWRFVNSSEIEIGNEMPYAMTMLEGGESEQPVTQEAKDRLLHWLTTEEGMPYIGKLSYVLREDTHTTDVVPRMFMGFPEPVRQHVAEFTEEILEELAHGTSGRN